MVGKAPIASANKHENTEQRPWYVHRVYIAHPWHEPSLPLLDPVLRKLRQIGRCWFWKYFRQYFFQGSIQTLSPGRIKYLS